MSIGYYGKKDGDKFAYGSIVKSGESSTGLMISNAICIISKPHLWLVGYGICGDFSNFNDKNWQFERELIAIRACIEPYSTEYQGKKRDYTPTVPELALLKIVESDDGLTKGEMTYTIEVNLGPMSVRFANEVLTNEPKDWGNNAVFILNIADPNVFDHSKTGYTLDEARTFVESKNPNRKSGGFGGKGSKFKSWEERLESTAKILDCDADLDSIYSKVKKSYDYEILSAVLELMKLS